MQILARCVILLWLTIGTGFAQSTISVVVPGNIYSVVKAELPAAEGQAATSFAIGFASNVAASPDGSGNLYVAVEAQNRVYKVTIDGRLFLFAGGDSGFSGDGEPAAQARLNGPTAVAVDQTGAVYIADSGNRAIRKVGSQGTITTLVRGIGFPRSLAVDNAGNVYVGLGSPGQLLKVTSDGSVTEIAGNGISGFSGDGGPALNASLGEIAGIAIDQAGTIYVSDNSNHRVRKITAGVITTIAGNGTGGFSGDGGPATAASVNQPRGLALDSAGNLYVADYLNHLIRRVDLGGSITTFAGRFVGNAALGSGGFSGDGGPATQAVMKNPMGIAIDPFGHLYIADSNNRRIRKVATVTNTISTFAGNGLLGAGRDTPTRTIAISSSGDTYVAGLGRVVYRLGATGGLQIFAGTDTFGFAGDGGPATSASFAGPNGLAVDSAGNLYIADISNHRIRRVSPDGRITTIVGRGASGFGGDEGPAIAATLSRPGALAVDKEGSLYIDDGGNRRLRKVTPDGIIHTIAGNGQTGFNGDGLATEASIASIGGIVIDSSGAVIISDGTNNRVRKITSDGQIRTIAGTGAFGFNGDGPALSTSFFTPWGLALDPDGTLYIADTNNSRIRRLTAKGTIETIAGSGKQGFAGDGGPALQAQLFGATGIAWHPRGGLYLTDSGNGAIRRVEVQPEARFSILEREAVSSVSPGIGAVTATGYAGIYTLGGSRPAGVAVLSSKDRGITVSEAGFAAIEPILSGRVVAEVHGSINTGISIVNPNDAAADVSFFFTNTAGNLGSGHFTVNARSQFNAFLTENPFNVPVPISGTFTFASTVPLAVTALRGFVNERSEFLITSLPITDLGAVAATTPIAIPHYASGGGWSTGITLVNPSDNTISGNAVLTDPQGNTTQQFAYTLNARGSQSVPVTVSGSGTSVGRILIAPSVGVTPAAYALVSYVHDGVTVTSTTMPAVPAARTVRLFAEMTGDFAHAAPGAAQTGVAIANTSNNPIQVIATVGPVRSLFPTPDERFVITLPANGQFSAFLKDILPKAVSAGDLQSVLRLEASGPIAVVGLRARLNERQELLVSSTPTTDEDAPPSTNPLYFPLFADSASFTTRFILFNAKLNSSSGGALRFFSPTGQVFNLMK